MCPMQFWISYVLGLAPNQENGWKVPTAQFKANQGTCTHKALELLARKKLALQNGEPCFADEELSSEWSASSFTIEDAIEEAWRHYSVGKDCFDWTPKEYKKVRRWVYTATEMCGGIFNPLNTDVLWPEKHFDFVIDKPEFAYRYKSPYDGSIIEGNLALKGTVDLIARVDGFPDIIELRDWKSGARKDWATGQPKDWKKLRNDPQLRIYHYALTKVVPWAKQIIVTIIWLEEGAAFSLDFGPEDIPVTERMLLDRFNTIRDCQRPKRIIGDAKHAWKCARLCPFGMSDWGDTGKTICDHLHGELLELGMERATAKYGRPDAFSQYGEGGGRSSREAAQSPT